MQRTTRSPAFTGPLPLLARSHLVPTRTSLRPPMTLPTPPLSPSPRRWRLPSAPTCKMVRVSVPTTIQAPAPFLYKLFSDLSRMPEWSTTLQSVTRDLSDPSYSTWKFSWNGVNLSWRARDKDPEPGEENEKAIRWGSVSGLKHVGVVSFEEQGDATRMTMTVEYDVASLIAMVMSSSMVSTFVESAIETELDRFRNFALRAQRKEKIESQRSV